MTGLGVRVRCARLEQRGAALDQRRSYAVPSSSAASRRRRRRGSVASASAASNSVTPAGGRAGGSGARGPRGRARWVAGRALVERLEPRRRRSGRRRGPRARRARAASRCAPAAARRLGQRAAQPRDARRRRSPSPAAARAAARRHGVVCSLPGAAWQQVGGDLLGARAAARARVRGDGVQAPGVGGGQAGRRPPRARAGAGTPACRRARAGRPRRAFERLGRALGLEPGERGDVGEQPRARAARSPRARRVSASPPSADSRRPIARRGPRRRAPGTSSASSAVPVRPWSAAARASWPSRNGLPPVASRAASANAAVGRAAERARRAARRPPRRRAGAARSTRADGPAASAPSSSASPPGRSARVAATSSTGTPSRRRPRNSRKRSDARSAQCRSSTTSASGSLSAVDHEPVDAVEHDVRGSAGVQRSPRRGEVSSARAAAPDSSRARSASSAAASTGSSSWRTRPNGKSRSSGEAVAPQHVQPRGGRPLARLAQQRGLADPRGAFERAARPLRPCRPGRTPLPAARARAGDRGRRRAARVEPSDRRSAVLSSSWRSTMTASASRSPTTSPSSPSSGPTSTTPSTRRCSRASSARPRRSARRRASARSSCTARAELLQRPRRRVASPRARCRSTPARARRAPREHRAARVHRLARPARAGHRRGARQLLRRRAADRARRRLPHRGTRRGAQRHGGQVGPRARHGDHHTLPRLARIDVAKELTYTARGLQRRRGRGARRRHARRRGPAAEAARELAAEIAGRSPDAVRAAKRLYDASLDRPARRGPAARDRAAAPRRLAEPDRRGTAGFTKQPGEFRTPSRSGPSSARTPQGDRSASASRTNGPSSRATDAPIRSRARRQRRVG